MTRITYTTPLEYQFIPAHRGAPYYIPEMEKFVNMGQLLEIFARAYRGLALGACDNKPWNEGSDIEEFSISIKSSGASLASIYAPTKRKIMDIYFTGCPSTEWLYMVIIDNEVIEYSMNKNEFKLFLENYADMTYESGHHDRTKLRFKKTSGKMLNWLDEMTLK